MAIVLASLLSSSYPRSIGSRIAGIYTYGGWPQPEARRLPQGPIVRLLNKCQHETGTTSSSPHPHTHAHTLMCAAGAPKVGNLAFVGEYSWRLGSKTYAWWNKLDKIPWLPPQVGQGSREGGANKSVGSHSAASQGCVQRSATGCMPRRAPLA